MDTSVVLKSLDLGKCEITKSAFFVHVRIEKDTGRF